MAAKRNILRRKWANIKNDFKRTWDSINDEDPDLLDDDLIHIGGFSSYDDEEGLRKYRRTNYTIYDYDEFDRFYS